jgi:hypothetical protein
VFVGCRYIAIKVRKKNTAKTKKRYSFFRDKKGWRFFVNLPIQHELHLMAEELRRHLSPSTLESLARETRFVQRSSKYRAQDPVALCVWMSQNIASASLTKLCSQLEASTGVLMMMQ